MEFLYNLKNATDITDLQKNTVNQVLEFAQYSGKYRDKIEDLANLLDSISFVTNVSKKHKININL